MKHRRIVAVVWEDSHLLASGWQTTKHALSQRKTIRCVSVGYVLADDRHGLVLAANRNGKDVAGVTVIPRRAIVDVRKVR